jgi:hypothetical protein
MNQKTIFAVIAVVLLIQGVAFYWMGDKMAVDTFPNIDETGKVAAVKLLQVISMLSIAVGLITYAARNSPQVLGAYALGFGLFSLNSLKHYFVDHINVPIAALVIQIAIALVCAYLWMQKSKAPQPA